MLWFFRLSCQRSIFLVILILPRSLFFFTLWCSLFMWWLLIENFSFIIFLFLFLSENVLSFHIFRRWFSMKSSWRRSFFLFLKLFYILLRTKILLFFLSLFLFFLISFTLSSSLTRSFLLWGLSTIILLLLSPSLFWLRTGLSITTNLGFSLFTYRSLLLGRFISRFYQLFNLIK